VALAELRGRVEPALEVEGHVLPAGDTVNEQRQDGSKGGERDNDQWRES